MEPGEDGDPDLERQRAEIEDAFRHGWRPADAGQPRVLTERACAEARAVLSRSGWTGLDQEIIQAVRDGAQPGDPLPPPQPRPYTARGVRLNLDCACALTLAGSTSPGIRRRSSAATSLACHGSSTKWEKVSMVKTRLARWASRWRERRLAREQKRQTSAARQAARAAQGQRYHSTGHGPQ